MLHYRLHCSCFITVPSIHTSLFMFHLISFSPHFIDHVSVCFLHSTVHLIHFTYHSLTCSYLPYLAVFILLGHSTILSVSLSSQSRLWKLTTYESLNKCLIFDRYSLLEAELRCFYYSLSLSIKQEIQQSQTGLSSLRIWCKRAVRLYLLFCYYLELVEPRDLVSLAVCPD